MKWEPNLAGGGLSLQWGEEVTNLANVQERKNEEEEATENFAIMLSPIS